MEKTTTEKRQNFVIGIPCKTSISWQLVDFLIKNKIENVIIEEGLYVSTNRNRITERFINDYDQDYLIYMDSDNVPKDIKFIEIMVNSNLPACTVPYPMLKKEGLKVTLLNNNTNKWYTYKEYKKLVKPGEFKFIETKITGGGCLAVKRDVLEKMEEPWWKQPSNTYMAREDILFCYDINKKGFPIMALVGATCSHFKEDVDLCDMVDAEERMQTTPIPKIIHQIWVGDKPAPYENYRETVKKMHPDWEYILWDEKRLLKEEMMTKEMLEELKDNVLEITHEHVHDWTISRRLRNGLIKISDISRYNVIKKYGGVYVDMDMFCLKPLDGLIKGCAMFAAFEGEARVSGLIGNSIFGCVPEHPLMDSLIKRLAKADHKEMIDNDAFKVTGPFIFTEELTKQNQMTIFNSNIFYPIADPGKVVEELKKVDNPLFKESYMVHPWGLDYDKNGILPKFTEKYGK